MEQLRTDPNIVHILWTGGWDSTYRIVELSRMDLSILPIYCCDPDRESTPEEKKVMLKILQALSTRPETKAHFYPIQYIDVSAIPENKEITDAHAILAADTGLGRQYEWLARLAHKYPGLEIGTDRREQALPTGCRATIMKHGGFTLDDGVPVINRGMASEECKLVLGNFHFPLADITEQEMLENIRAWGYEDIMKLSWFCHAPMNGQPCGMCTPCRHKMENDMAFLLPEKAQQRYHLYKKTGEKLGESKLRTLAEIVYRNFM